MPATPQPCERPTLPHALPQGGDDVAREWSVGGLVDGDELATGMGQTECELDLGMTAGQPLVAPVPIDLENAGEALNLRGEIRHRASVGIDVSDRGRGRTAHGRSSTAWLQNWPHLVRPRPRARTGIGVSSLNTRDPARMAASWRS